MKDIYNNYKKEIKKTNNILVLILVIFVIGVIFGSIYITILKNPEKQSIMTQVNNYFLSMNKISFETQIVIFKNSLISNLLYFIFVWLLGLSVIGIPIIILMVFFKSFILGFSISSIFAKYGAKGILGAFIYIFPSSLTICIFTIFLSTYSLILAFKLLQAAFTKKTINFRTFMGKYFFVLLVAVLLSVLCSLIDAFLSPHLYKIFTNFIK